MANKTEQQFNSAIKECVDIFTKKMEDYGTAWRILRPSSLTDQIYIKAQRIRSIEEKGSQKIDDSIRGEYIGIINYCSMALIQCSIGYNDNPISNSEIANLFVVQLNNSRDLMLNKNHDYGEAWRQMRITSYTDLILMKIKRTKQIEDNKGNTIISEGVEANYMDMINYAIFALIRLEENN
ncbi:DUF1599 domain-containing protein [Halosquirtibacter laminarini]|uniref:DUF1599 domain-containing protein n=1 Tax=Halosquirtibacter laminarini TaxID=3374600 RepID=A0AC61NK25_9BACT|nr:DUF1599 domain-containing protein [Prolixibacteraceae bacterium]